MWPAELNVPSLPPAARKYELVHHDGPKVAGRSTREVDVTLAVLRGLSVKEIAVELQCSPHTATQHLRTIFLKLGVSSRGELAARLLGGSYAPVATDAHGTS